MTGHIVNLFIRKISTTIPFHGVYSSEGIRISNIIQYITPGGHVQMYLYWDECEPVRNSFTWPTQFESDLAALKKNNNLFTICIKHTPDWAKRYPGFVTSPPKKENYPDLAYFVNVLIAHCGTGLYAVSLFNEPDTVLQELSPTWPYFGAWIDANNPSQGGKDYAEMTRTVYQTVKSLHKSISIFAGELMHTQHKHFLNDALANGLYCDVLSAHSYIRYEWMAQYGLDKKKLFDAVLDNTVLPIRRVTKLPLALTETALLYQDVNAVSGSALQAEFYNYMLKTAVNYRLFGWNWYFLGGDGFGWENSEMISKQGNFKPVYPAYKASGK